MGFVLAHCNPAEEIAQHETRLAAQDEAWRGRGHPREKWRIVPRKSWKWAVDFCGIRGQNGACTEPVLMVQVIVFIDKNFKNHPKPRANKKPFWAEVWTGGGRATMPRQFPLIPPRIPTNLPSPVAR